MYPVYTLEPCVSFPSYIKFSFHQSQGIPICLLYKPTADEVKGGSSFTLSETNANSYLKLKLVPVLN
jgi:hypothetical protein